MTESNSDYLVGLIVFILFIVGGFFIYLSSSFTVSNYVDDDKYYLFKTYFFGHWGLEEDDELLHDGGVG